MGLTSLDNSEFTVCFDYELKLFGSDFPNSL